MGCSAGGVGGDAGHHEHGHDGGGGGCRVGRVLLPLWPGRVRQGVGGLRRDGRRGADQGWVKDGDCGQ